MLEKIVEKGKEVFAEGTALTWYNLPRVVAENLSGIDPQASAKSMIGATAIKYALGPALQWTRKKTTNYLEAHGFKFEGVDNGKKKIDQALGLLLAAGEVGVNMVAYNSIYQNNSGLSSAIIPSMVSTALTAIPQVANLNGRLLDSVLDARGLPNNGRSFFSPSATPERKREIMNTANAMLLGFAGYYTIGTKLVEMLYR